MRMSKKKANSIREELDQIIKFSHELRENIGRLEQERFWLVSRVERLRRILLSNKDCDYGCKIRWKEKRHCDHGFFKEAWQQ